MLTTGKTKLLGFLNHIFSPISLLVQTLFIKSSYYLELKDKGKDRLKPLEMGFGLIVTLLLLLLIIPLLSSTTDTIAVLFSNFNRFLISSLMIGFRYPYIHGLSAELTNARHVVAIRQNINERGLVNSGQVSKLHKSDRSIITRNGSQHKRNIKVMMNVVLAALEWCSNFLSF